MLRDNDARTLTFALRMLLSYIYQECPKTRSQFDAKAGAAGCQADRADTVAAADVS